MLLVQRAIVLRCLQVVAILILLGQGVLSLAYALEAPSSLDGLGLNEQVIRASLDLTENEYSDVQLISKTGLNPVLGEALSSTIIVTDTISPSQTITIEPNPVIIPTSSPSSMPLSQSLGEDPPVLTPNEIFSQTLPSRVTHNPSKLSLIHLPLIFKFTDKTGSSSDSSQSGLNKDSRQSLPQNGVIFPNALVATTTDWQSARMSVTVPAGVSAGPMQVRTDHGNSNSLDFDLGSSAVPDGSSEGSSWSSTFSGQINSNTTWSSNILLTGDVTVPSGVTLTIEPGVTVFFSAGSDDQNSGRWTNKAELRVSGTLVAEGSEQNPIHFTSNASSKAASDWGGIIILKNSTTSSLKHAVIRYAEWGVAFYANKQGGGSVSSEISHCFIADNTLGIYHYGNPGYPAGGVVTINPTIQHNTIKNNTDYGIRLIISTGYGTSNDYSTIKNNLIIDNKVGLQARVSTWWLGHSNLAPEIINNTIRDSNSIGLDILAFGSGDGSGSDTKVRPVVRNNLFLDNSTNLRLYLDPKGSDGVQKLEPTVQYNTFEGGTDAIVVDDTQNYDTINPIISHNLFANFSNKAINNLTARSITANDNYWGRDETAWDAGPQVGDIAGTVVTSSYLDRNSVPIVTRLAPGLGQVGDELLVYGANFMPLNRSWRAITPTLSPPYRGEHSLAYYDVSQDNENVDTVGQGIILYGGNATGWPYQNDTWTYDGTNWLQISPTQTPTARYGSASVYDGQKVILFGGSDENDTALNQTWAYNSSTWSQLSPNTSPPARTYANMTGKDGKFFLFGGNDQTTYFNDLWLFEGGGWLSVTLADKNLPPQARSQSALAYDSDNNRLYLFGGVSVTGTILSDFWIYVPATKSWTELSATGPSARMAHSLSYDPLTQKLVLFGGTPDNGDSYLNDTWLYDGIGWTQVNDPAPPPPQAYHQLIYTDNGLTLFGQEGMWRYE